MAIKEALRAYFEEQLEFRLEDGNPIDGSVYIGETEFLPVETLRDDDAAYAAEFDRWHNDSWAPEQADRRTALLALRANRGRFQDLCEAISREQVIPLVGSGLCVPSGLPTWANLLRKVRAYTTVDPTDLETMLGAYKYEEAADLLAAAMNARLLDERIEQELRVVQSVDQVTGAIRLLPGVFPNLVLTTNLDPVLELQYGGCGVPFQYVLGGPEIAQYRHLKNPQERFVLKLHGDGRRKETRVILSAEYDTAYAIGGVVYEELALLFRTQHILFIGASLGADRTVSLIAAVAGLDNNTPKHWAFLAQPPVEAEWLSREQFLTERGIYPIWYDGSHDESITALLAGLPGLDA